MLRPTPGVCLSGRFRVFNTPSTAILLLLNLSTSSFAGELRGVTRRINGAVAPDVPILIHAAGANASIERSASSGAVGLFSVSDLPAGVYEVTADGAKNVSVNVNDSGPTEVTLTVVHSAVESALSPSAPAGQQAPATPAAEQKPPTVDQQPPRRAPDAPIDSIFPSSEYLGPTIGVPDTDPVWPLTQAIWDVSPWLKKHKIKIYGWLNAGGDASTSNKSNVPASYAIVPNKLQMDQAVLRFERVPDTVQTGHVDWGFRLSGVYGIDYRYTTAQGYFSEQLLKRNSLYGADPVEAYGLVYIPHVAQGMVIQFGRYISPPDIEAQLAPANYLYTHSLMFTVDCYTQTGINAAIKLNDRWTIQFGVHAGDDIAPWNAAAQPTGMFMVRWTSKSNNDSLWGGIDSINGGRFQAGHDDLQQNNLTWTHRFNKSGIVFTSTEAYYIFQSGALVGGTVNSGPPRPFLLGTGAGAPIPGNASAIGFVSYTEIKVSKHDFISLRPLDILDDKKGERTGFPTTYESWTAGLTHRFSGLISVRPELRYEYAYSAKPYDNGTKNHQLMFAIDAIVHF